MVDDAVDDGDGRLIVMEELSLVVEVLVRGRTRYTADELRSPLWVLPGRSRVLPIQGRRFDRNKPALETKHQQEISKVAFNEGKSAQIFKLTIGKGKRTQEIKFTFHLLKFG